MTYKERQKDVQEALFDRSQLGGKFKGKYHPSYDRFILKNYRDNFIEQVCYDDVIKYFDENGIGWWNGDVPTTHTLSSQIACINHLFPLRKNRAAVLALARSIDPEFESVEILENDKGQDGYISFEVVSATDHLNEKRGQDNLKRGALCTSIDAMILAKKKGKRVMLTIEWKYVESYGNEDKSQNVANGRTSGDTRLRRYSGLIQNSEQLKSFDNYRGSVYFFEPFYQLMRQTLWAEQMVKHKNNEVIKADDYVHVHIVPTGNNELLHKKYPCSGGKDMLTTWKGQLKNPNKYVLISPAELFSKLPCDDWKELICTLKKRYWQ